MAELNFMRILIYIVIFVFPVLGNAALTIEPITWNVIGLDSNNVNVGPNTFPVGVKVCSTDSSSVTASVEFSWDDLSPNPTPSPYVKLSPDSLDKISLTLPGQASGIPGCNYAYFNVMVDRDSRAYGTVRNYHITSVETGNQSNSAVTPTPRQIYVEYLVSQSRNATTDISYSTNGTSFTSVPIGGAFSLAAGGTYWLKLSGYTATQGYNQLESFIELSNNVFQVESVVTTYSSPYGTVIQQLYSDACGWQNDPLIPNYLSCVVSDNKAGGTVTNTYKVRILSKPSGGGAIKLASTIYDFSGSSYHYNSDYASSARYLNIISPTLGKSFSPKTVSQGGSTTLTFTINNPTATNITNASFDDSFPSGMQAGGGSSVTYSNWSPLKNK